MYPEFNAGTQGLMDSYSCLLLCTVVWFLTLQDEYGLMLLKHRVLTKIIRPKSEEVPGGWRKLQNEDFHGLYCSLNARMSITPRKIGWVVNVVHITEKKMPTRFWLENLKERDHLEDLRLLK